MKQAYLATALLAAVAITSTPACADERNPWNGLYVGLNGGYSWQSVSGIFNNAGNATDLSGIDLNGAMVGGQLGYNYQSGQFLLGIEGDASTLVDGDSVTNDAALATFEHLNGDISYLASIRGRLGWAINNWLLFGTVGWGFTEFRFAETAPNATPAFSGKLRLKDEGVVFGGGVEWMLSYGVSLRAEYLRYDLGASTPIPGSFTDADAGDHVSFDNIDVARAALNIKLSP